MSLRLSLTVASLALAAVLLSGGVASASVTIGASGQGAGQYDRPEALAVDPAEDRLYVADGRNNRVDVFDLSGTFVMAFGWGVADGESAEPQVCTTTCFAGFAGGGAGEFEGLTGVAVDQATHRIYTYDSNRVQEFEPSGEFLRAWGGGVLAAGAAGTATLSTGSKVLTNVAVTEGSFERGAAITGTGLAAGTKIISLGDGTITVSEPATASGSQAISVAEAPGNVPVNERQELTTDGSSSLYRLNFRTGNPSPSELETANIPQNASAATIQAALATLSNIGAGNVAVTGPAGGPYIIEFKGTRLGDTDLGRLVNSGSAGPAIVTLQNGHSAPEVCTVAAAESCTGGAESNEPGGFASSGKLTVGGSGQLIVADAAPLGALDNEGYSARAQIFDPSGAQLDEFPLTGISRPLSSIAVDPASGDLYVLGSGGIGMRRYDSAGACLNCAQPLLSGSSIFATAIAVDSVGHLFASFSDTAGRLIEEFDSSEEQVGAYGYGEIERGSGGLVIHHSAEGDVFVSEGEGSSSKVVYLDKPAPGPIIPALLSLTKADPIRSARATLNGFVNPEGKDTTYHFEYVEAATYEADVASLGPDHGFDHAIRMPASAGEDPLLEGDYKAHEVSREALGLSPETAYRFRLVASNADAETSFEGAPFQTLDPLELLDLWATDVEADSVVLNASVNPLGSLATGYFEYVDDATYRADIEALGAGHGFDHAKQGPDVNGGAGPLQFGSAESPQTRKALVHTLPPDTVYHYRLRVTNPFTTRTSSEKVFSTVSPPLPRPEGCPNQATRLGTSRYLPDCRSYELVSPVEKDGGDVLPARSITGYSTAIDRSSLDGEKLTYTSNSAFGEVESAPYASQYIAARDASGWQSEAIAPPRGPSFYGGDAIDTEFAAFSGDLCSAWLVHNSEPILEPSAPKGFPAFYRRDNCDDDGAYEVLSTATPKIQPSEFLPELQGTSVDGAYAVFRVRDKLTADAGSDRYQVYISHESALRLVCKLPNGLASPQNCSAGTANQGYGFSRQQSVSHAVSADGSRIFWTASASTSGAGQIYVRKNPFGTGGQCAGPTSPCTVAVSQAAESLSGVAGSQFWTAAADGGKAIFTTGEDLYEFDVESKATGLIAHKVKGVMGASEDATRIYFVSTEVLDGGAVPEEPNLYLHESGGGFTFVATLSARDMSPNITFGPLERSPIQRTSRVSADGLRAAFTTSASVTGYDNLDAVSGAPVDEVYLFDATAANGEGAVICGSCNPDGARPRGIEVPGVNRAVSWVAAEVPPWQNQLYAPRVLPDNGHRLLFNSYESLVQRDTNGKADVYQLELVADAAACAARGAELVLQGGACLSLISTGESPGESVFLDASPDGDDVFFSTYQGLVPEDMGLLDIYDARVGGGFPPPAQPPAGCEGEACQAPPAPPDDPTPASAALIGEGNVRTSSPRKPPRCKKRKGRGSKRRCAGRPTRAAGKDHGNGHKRRAGR